MKINILCLKSTILFITATYRIFMVTHNTLNQTFNIKKRADNVTYYKTNSAFSIA